MDLITRKTELSANIVSFCRFLREKGFVLGPREEADALEALAVTPVKDPDRFRLTLRAVLPRSLKQQELFDEFYPVYWKNLERAVDSKVKELGEENQKPGDKPKKQQAPSLQQIKDWLYGKPGEEEAEIATYSAHEALGYKDFSSFTEDDLEEVKKLIILVAKKLAAQFNRRFRTVPSSANFDLRKTMRKNMRRGGEIVDMYFRQRKKRKVELVLLCDVSKSMDLYSRFLVQFIYAFQTIYKRIDTFVFSTSLHHIKDQMQERTFYKALDNLSETVPGWSGGTQIGSSLAEFVKDHGHRCLNKQSVVLIMSDGWDTGEPEVLQEAMRQIHKKASRVIWLNPLAGNPNFEASAMGMASAMPYIDIFASAHNIDSLRKALGKSI